MIKYSMLITCVAIESQATVFENVTLKNYSLIDNDIILKMIEGYDNKNLQEYAKDILYHLAKTGLKVSYDIVNDHLTFIVSTHEVYNAYSLENPFMCDTGIGNKIIACPTFQKLQNNIWGGYLIHSHLQNLKREYYQMYGEILFSRPAIENGKRYCQLLSVGYRVYDIGYNDIHNQINDFAQINNYIIPDNILSPLISLISPGYGYLQDKAAERKMVESINRFISQQNYTGSVINTVIYENQAIKQPTVFVKVNLNSGQKVKVNKIVVQSPYYALQIEKYLYKVGNISKPVINSIVEPYGLICSEVKYENEPNSRNTYVFLTHSTNAPLLKDINIQEFSIQNGYLMEIASYYDLVAGKPLNSNKLQEYTDLLKKLSGAQPNIQQADDNGLILTISSGLKPNRIAFITDNMGNALDFNQKDGLSINPLSINFHGIKNMPLSLVFKPGIQLKTSSISLKDWYEIFTHKLALNPSTQLYAVKDRYIIDANIGWPITINTVYKMVMTKNLHEINPVMNIKVNRLLQNGNLSFNLKSQINYKHGEIEKDYNRWAKNNDTSPNDELPVFFTGQIGCEREVFKRHNINVDLTVNSGIQGYYKNLYGANIEGNLFTYIDLPNDRAIIFNFTGGCSYSGQYKHGFFSTSDIHAIGYEDHYFVKHGFGSRMFITKQLMDSSKILGAAMISLKLVTFISAFYTNIMDKSGILQWKKLLSAGIMFAVDIQGSFIYIAFYYNMNGPGVSLSSTRAHMNGRQNAQKSMQLLMN